MDKSKKKLIIEIIVFIIVIILISVLYNKFAYQNVEKDMDNNIKEEDEKMSVLKLTSENFEEEVLKSNEFVVVDFYADWCGPCQMLKPVLEQVEKEHPEVEFEAINIDDKPELAEQYEVMSIPTLVVLNDDGEIHDTLIGVKSKAEIEQAILG